MKIPFNKSSLTGHEMEYMAALLRKGDLSSDGEFSQKCTALLEQKYSIHRVLLTPSCTSALEMAGMLCDLRPGDEVILPSYTFPSTANAIVRLGAIPVFVDIRPDTLNIDEDLIEVAITDRTKAIIAVHYAGVSCNMDRLVALARKYELTLLEDAAQGVNAFTDNQALGSIGALGAYSFHSTKNYGCGEGGALCVNSPALVERAEIIREKGTNRTKFLRGDIDRYSWVDIGSSYVPSEIVSAFLLAQLETIESTTQKRKTIFEFYNYHLNHLQDYGLMRLPFIPRNCRTNYHLYYLLLPTAELRTELMTYLNEMEIGATSHYVPLHTSPMGRTFGYETGDLPVTEDLSKRLLRLPIYPNLSEPEQMKIISEIKSFMLQRQVLKTQANVIVRGREL